MISARRPISIQPTYHEKVWGRLRDGVHLGEIWFRAEPLLLKFIFTSEKLSVQVHPGDDYARRHENSAGKTECWYVMAAEPGAQLAVGLRREMTPEEIRESVRAQTIEQELNWLVMRPGDFVFVPWGTVHAIGPGLTLCEIQQFSDITYRLYDYGRPRELHLSKALEVARRHPAAGRIEPVRIGSGDLAHDFLIACRHFAVERLAASREYRGSVDPKRFEVLAFLEGEGEIVAEGLRELYRAEQMWRLPEELGDYRIAPRRETAWLKVYVPPSLAGFGASLARAGVSQADQRRIIVEDI